MKKLYYTIDIETECWGAHEPLTATGNKTITVYTVENNEVKEWFQLEKELEDVSEDEIYQYLNDNGYGDDSIKLIKL